MVLNLYRVLLIKKYQKLSSRKTTSLL